MASLIYPAGDEQQTLNLGLATWGMDEVLAQNMILIDASAVQINGSFIPNLNFVDSATVTFSVVGSNVSATAAGGGSGFVKLAPTADQTITGDFKLNLFGTGQAYITPNIDASGAPALNLGTGDGFAQTGEYTILIDQVGSAQGLYINDNLGDTVSLSLVGATPFLSLSNAAGLSVAALAGLIGASDALGNSLVIDTTGGKPSLEFGTAAGGSASITFLGTVATNPLALPLTTGLAGQVLSTSGGSPQQLSWITPASGGGTVTLTAAAPTVTAGQIGLGSTTNATIGANGGAAGLTALPVGYIIVNVGGTNYEIPFYNV